MKLRLAHGTLVLTLLGTAALGADIYRSTGPDGTVTYSDRPQSADAEVVASTAPRARVLDAAPWKPPPRRPRFAGGRCR